MKLTRLQIALITTTALLTVLLFFAKTKPDLTEVKITASVDRQIDSAIAMVNGGNPMQGIFLLRDLAEEHPENMRIQLNLGMFAVQSGQFDKAEARFNTVLKQNPQQAEALYYLGYVKAQNGLIEEAVKLLRKASESAESEELKQEIEKYINELNS